MTRRQKGGGRLRFLLALLCGGLGLAVWNQWDAPTEIDPPPPPQGAAGAPPPLPEVTPFVPPMIEDFTEFVERPLFQADRRPPEPPEDAPIEIAPAEVPAGEFVLVGVVISLSERLALIQQAGAGELLRLGVGGVVNGWSVQSIEPDRVFFTYGEILKEVKLRDDVPPKQPPKKRKRRRRRATPEREAAPQAPPGDETE